MEAEDFDAFYHYDSTSAAVADNKLTIGVPADGPYWICFSNITITYGNGVTPDASSGFLVLEGTEEIQSAGICAPGTKTSKLYFPLFSPGTTTPVTKTYNKILLRTTDYIALVVHNNAFEKLTTTRLVATIHISSNPDVIRYVTK